MAKGYLEDVWIGREQKPNRQGFPDARCRLRIRVEDHDLSHVLDPEGEEIGQLGHVRRTNPSSLTQATLHRLISRLLVHKDLEI